jgi:hypothetical protein
MITFSFIRVLISKVKALLRLVFFVWTVALEKILTLDNLRKMNVIEVN